MTDDKAKDRRDGRIRATVFRLVSVVEDGETPEKMLEKLELYI